MAVKPTEQTQSTEDVNDDDIERCGLRAGKA